MEMCNVKQMAHRQCEGSPPNQQTYLVAHGTSLSKNTGSWFASAHIRGLLLTLHWGIILLARSDPNLGLWPYHQALSKNLGHLPWIEPLWAKLNQKPPCSTFAVLAKQEGLCFLSGPVLFVQRFLKDPSRESRPQTLHLRQVTSLDVRSLQSQTLLLCLSSGACQPRQVHRISW